MSFHARFQGGPLDGQNHQLETLDELVAVDREWLTHRGIMLELQSAIYAQLPDTDVPTYVFKGYEDKREAE